MFFGVLLKTDKPWLRLIKTRDANRAGGTRACLRQLTSEPASERASERARFSDATESASCGVPDMVDRKDHVLVPQLPSGAVTFRFDEPHGSFITASLSFLCDSRSIEGRRLLESINPGTRASLQF